MEKQVERFGPFKDFIADGVKVNNTIYLSGAVSIDMTGQVVGTDDFFAQVEQTYSNIAAVLERFGATMDDIADEMWLVTDISIPMSNLQAMGLSREKAYGGTPQVTQTMVQVAGLVMPELMIEIKCIAHLE